MYIQGSQRCSMTKGCGLTLHVGDFLPWAVGGRFHSHVPSLLKADFLFCLSFLSERPPHTHGKLSHPSPYSAVCVGFLVVGWPLGNALMYCYFSFYVEVSWGSLDSCSWLGSKDSSACDQRQYSRVRLVGIGERGLFHIWKDNIITCLRLTQKFFRGTMAVRQREKNRSHHPPNWWLVGDPAFPDSNTRHPSRESKAKLRTGSWIGTCLPGESQKSVYMGKIGFFFPPEGYGCDGKGSGNATLSLPRRCRCETSPGPCLMRPTLPSSLSTIYFSSIRDALGPKY